MAEKKEDREPDQTNPKSWLNRRTFVGSLVALFGALNVWVFGKREGWWSNESSGICELIVKGPFHGDKRMPLASRTCNFVEPRSIKIQGRDDGVVKAVLAFMFKGPENSKRQIDVRLDFYDASGNVLASKQLVCNDARHRARNPVPAGSVMIQLSRVNHEVLKLQMDPPQMDSIALAKIRFLEI